MSRLLVLLRHGRTAWNVAGRVQGRTDVPLDHVGRAQAEAAARMLVDLEPDRIVSSDLVRAYATALAVGDATGVEVELDPRLQEMGFGQREGLTFRESWEQFPEAMRALHEGGQARVPGAETHEEAAARFVDAVTDLIDSMEPDDVAVVVSHGATLRTGALHFVGVPPEHWKVFGGLENCACIYLEESPGPPGRWRIAEWNTGQLPEPVLSDDDQG